MDVHDELPAAVGDESRCPASGGDYPRIHAYKLAHELRDPQGVQRVATANFFADGEGGAVLTVVTSAGHCERIPRSKKRLLEMASQAIDLAKTMRD